MYIQSPPKPDVLHYADRTRLARTSSSPLRFQTLLLHESGDGRWETRSSKHIRSRFTELDVPPPDEDPETLVEIIAHYIGHLTTAEKSAGKTIVSDVAQFYTAVKAIGRIGEALRRFEPPPAL